MKWTKVTPYALEAYKAYMDVLFFFIKQGKLKVRIMFTQNVNELTPAAREKYKNHNKFYRLYYQFLKHSFGLTEVRPEDETPLKLSLFMDDLPDKTDDLKQFKKQLVGLSDIFHQAEICAEDIIEINSAKHPILQAIDIVLGAMQFRLTDLHKVKPAGKLRRAERTKAKEELYKHILAHIKSEMPHFNIGVSTGDWGWAVPAWQLPYAHRSYFIPEEKRLNLSRGKKFKS